MNLSMNEAIDLIVQFMTFLGGCWSNEVEENDLAKRFIEADGALLDEEHADKYIVSDEGRDILHPYIQKISQELIHFMLSNGASCSETEGTNWMMAKYGIEDFDKAETLLDYITFNLSRYGYERSIGYRRDKMGDNAHIKLYSIRKIN